ncbi:hypothetical protein SYNPS1DRAFT_27288 [Syncephalis pseudoplumigaleata]|uniref:Uncharacterized protein n=1 Tax=Syncephalis pseudoplumigaleata TaxID=1712513 RepID=A0A4P9Z3S8_9FUNG|nr:hypothetical protein SYNPS1DRAFT_27288 [Syncephalis pseudoplumigaleata]|eukprot:RKP27048.1 hypothetical protein SYNPS1DRAFT_27288 [Syncephalis pseudoplumigaleata]
MARRDAVAHMNAFEFLNAQEQGNSTRPTGIFFQVMLSTVMLVVFLRNIYYAVSLVRKYPRKIAPWCSLSIATTGALFFGGFGLPFAFPGGPSCRTLLFALSIALTLCSMAISIILLERAYLAHCRNRYLLVIGMLLILLESLLFYVLSWMTEAHIAPAYGCHAHFLYYVPVVHFLLTAPANTVLSVAFLIVVYRKYRRYGEKCWRLLVREGTVTMLLVLGSNFLCMICNAFRLFSGNTPILYVIECGLISTVIVESLRRLDTFMYRDDLHHQHATKLQHTLWSSDGILPTIVHADLDTLC